MYGYTHTYAHTHVATSHVPVHMLQMYVHTHMTHLHLFPPHMCTQTTLTHTYDSQQSIWRKLPDVPYQCSSICVVDGVLIAVGGHDQHGTKTSAIYGFCHHDDQMWGMLVTCHLHVPGWTHCCCQGEGSWWLMGGVLDRSWKWLWKVIIVVLGIEFIRLYFQV